MFGLNVDVNIIFFYTFLATGIIYLTYLIYCLVRKYKNQKEKQIPSLVDTAKSIFIVLFFVLIFRTVLFEPFNVPTGSMIPTIKEGDFVLVSKYNYGINLVYPYKKIIEYGEPKRGDVIVFRYPENISINYIKRLIGLPGDKIEYNFDSNELFINDKKIVREKIESEKNLEFIGKYYETLGDKTYQIQHYPIRFRCSDKNFEGVKTKIWNVPEGHYFALGDNRISSLDSRCWGFVPYEYIIGKGQLIFANWKENWYPTFNDFRLLK